MIGLTYDPTCEPSLRTRPYAIRLADRRFDLWSDAWSEL